MKSIKKVLASVLALAMVVTAVPATTAEAATTGVPKTKTYYAGKSYTLTLTTPKSWKSVKTTWSEKNSAISLSSKKTKSVKVKAIKATKKATVKVKVTYKKSSKKGAKRYTKNYKTVITVKNPSLSVKAAATTLTVGETAKLTVKKTPNSATVKYSSSDDAVASVSKGVITANGVGTAVITTKLTCGTKTISKNITVKVTEAVDDGISATLLEQFDSVNYPDTVITNPEINKNRTANLRVYYGKNGKGVNDRTLVIKTREIGTSKTYTFTTTTDANGIAYFNFDLDGFNPVAKIEYTISADDDSSVAPVKKTITLAKIAIKSVFNVNGCDGKTKKADGKSTDYKAAGYADLNVSENDINGTKGDGLTSTDGTWTNVNNVKTRQYATQFVDSQQVSPAGTTKNQVGFIGGTPVIVLPGDGTDLSSGKAFQQDVNITSGKYDTYASDSKYITLNVKPDELTYATLNFTDLTLSKYTRLQIEAFKSEADAKAVKGADGKYLGLMKKADGSADPFYLYGPTKQNNFAYQIPLNLDKTSADSLCLKVTLVSQGQVDTASNLGYTIKDITGVYKNKESADQDTQPLKGATVTWSQTTPMYDAELPLNVTLTNLATNVDLTIGHEDATTKKVIAKVTYRVPVFPYAGNAIITAYDKNNEVIAYFACPTKNNGSNKNVLDTSAQWVYRISEEEAFNSVGSVSQAADSDVVTVNSDKAGTTYLEGKISGPEGLFDDTNNKVYTSVQWNPVQPAAAGRTGAIAFAGQEVTVTAQLVDSNKNVVTNAGTPVTFKYVKPSDASTGKTTDIANTTTPLDGVNGDATVLGIEPNTNSKGQATLKLSAAIANTVITQIQASANKYNVVLTVNGESVEQLDLYWVEAEPAFGVTASDEPASIMDKKVTGEITTAQKYCEPTIGENWEYAFKTVIKSTNQKLPNAGTWANKPVSVENAKIDITVDSDSKGTVKTDTGINGMVTATSKEPGETTLNAKIDGTEYDKNGVIFDVDGKETKSVGTGTTSFSNKQKLEINWKSNGLSGAFVNVNGVNAVTGASGTFDLYFKVADSYGNAKKDAAVKIKSSQVGSIKEVWGSATSGSSVVASKITPFTADSTEVYADKDGIIIIKLDKSIARAAKEMITVTLNGVPYTQTITWKTGAGRPAVTLDDTTSKDQSVGTTTSADPFKTYADNSKIVLTFTDEILASSVIADQFTVGRDNGTNYDKVEIGSVTVSGKQIILTFKQPITDGLSKKFAVQVKDQTVNGITYKITTTEGDVVSLPTGNSSTIGDLAAANSFLIKDSLTKPVK